MVAGPAVNGKAHAMKYYQMSRFVLVLAVALASGWSLATAAQADPALVLLRQRLVEGTGAEYVAARDEALALPEDSFNDLLFLLRLSPEYSLEQVLALILEARTNHPEEAARFDRDFKHMLENPDMTG